MSIRSNLNILLLVSVVVAGARISTGAEPANGQVDALFADDLYVPTLPLGESKPWEINAKLLAEASVTGEASLDASARLRGKSTIRLRPAADQQRATVQWTRDVEPARYYNFSAAYRSAPRLDSDTPAKMPMYGLISIEWLDARGARIAVRDKLVSRPSTDAFWTVLQAKGLTPPGAVQARVNLIAGWHEPHEGRAAWFGDIRWEAVQETPLVLELWPRIMQTRDDRFTITVRRQHPGTFTTDSRLKVELLDAKGIVRREWHTSNMMTTPWITELKLPSREESPADDTADAGWTVRASAEPIRANVGAVTWTASEPVLIANSNLTNRILDRRFVMGGEKRFIIGAYHAEPEDFAILKKAGFNTMLTREYDAQEATKLFDQLQSLGLYGTASLGGGGQSRGNQPRVEGVIRALRPHPALLAFDLMDEPTRKGIGPREIAWYARWVQSLAPDVPTTMNECGPYVFDRFSSTVDVFSVDPYPVYVTLDSEGSAGAVPDMDMVTRWLELARQTVPADRPFIGVVECFTFDKEQRRPPTGDEVRNMVYQTLASGAAGVVYYSIREPKWHLPSEPLFEDIAAINAEVAALESWLTTPPLDKRAAPVQVDAPRIDRIVTATWKQGQQHMMLLINLDREVREVRLSPAPGSNIEATAVPQTLTLQPLAVEKIQFTIGSAGAQASTNRPEVAP